MQIVERKDRSIIVDGIVDSDIRSRNFAGKEKRHPVTGQIVNGEGYRNFLLYHLPDDLVQELQARGCEVKFSNVTNPNDVPTPYVSISVSYYLKPVDVQTFANGVQTILDENHVGHLDSMDISRMCIGLEFGKQKTRRNGNVYTPIYASTIWATITPNYFAESFGGTMATTTLNVEPNGETEPF